MPDTLRNIPITTEIWHDIYLISLIGSGTAIKMQNIGTTDLYYSISSTQPEKDSDFFKILIRAQDVIFDRGDLKIWVFSSQCDGLVNIERFVDNITDFSVKVGLGFVPGISTAAVVMRNPSASNLDFFDVWSGGGNIVLPTSLEQWEIVSDNVNDINLSGSGAWTVLINSLDDNYVIQTPVIVELNGTTPVLISGTHFRTHQLSPGSSAIVLSAGSTRKNLGNLTIRVSGGGNIRMKILKDVGKSEDGHISVPAGITLLGLTVLNPWEKDQAGSLTNFITPSATNSATIQAGIFPAYQNDLTIIFQAKFLSNEKTDRVFKAKPINDGAEITVVEEFYVIDNSLLDL